MPRASRWNYARGVAPPSVAGKHGGCGRRGVAAAEVEARVGAGSGVGVRTRRADAIQGVVHEHGAREEIRGGNGSLHRRGKTRADAVAADADVSLVLEDAGGVVVGGGGRFGSLRERGAEPARAHVRRELARLLFRSYGASAASVALAGDFVHARHIFGGHLRHALGRLEALIHLAVLEVLDVVPERLVLAPRFERAQKLLTHILVSGLAHQRLHQVVGVFGNRGVAQAGRPVVQDPARAPTLAGREVGRVERAVGGGRRRDVRRGGKVAQWCSGCLSSLALRRRGGQGAPVNVTCRLRASQRRACLGTTWRFPRLRRTCRRGGLRRRRPRSLTANSSNRGPANLG